MTAIAMQRMPPFTMNWKKTFASVDALIQNDRLEEAAQRIEEIVEMERAVHEGPHPHILRMTFAALENWLKADRADRASRSYAKIVADAALVDDESQKRLKGELEQMCELIWKRAEKWSVYIAPDQFGECPAAFSKRMPAIFQARVSELIGRGDIAAARQLISNRAAALNARDSTPFRENETASALWVAALGTTGTAAFELRMDAVSDRMYRAARGPVIQNHDRFP